MGSPATKTTSANGAQTIRANAQTAQACALGANGQCAFCQRTGVPILPLRYAVIPRHALRSWSDHVPNGSGTLGSRLKDKKLKFHRYTIRALRAGFVHVYLGQPGHWQVYAVSSAGHLRLLPNPDDLDAKTQRELSPQCMRQGHNIPASFIHVPPRYAKAKIWVALSQDAWPAKVRADYEKAPGKRMQVFDCAALANAPDAQLDAFEIKPGNAELPADAPAEWRDIPFSLPANVEEYPFGPFGANRHRFNGTEVVDKNRNGVFDDGEGVWQSVHGLTWRGEDLPALGRMAADQAKQTQGKQKLAAIVLDDPVGIVQELNKSRMQQVNFRAQYSASVLRPQMISQAIIGLKNVVESSALAARTKAEVDKGKPDVQTETIHIPDDLPSKSQRLTYTTTRAERAAADAKQMWSRLAARYDEGKRKAFDTQFKAKMAEYATHIGETDDDYAKWSKDPAWLAWLADYDTRTATGATGLIELCAPCLAGGPVGKASKQVWKTWLDEQKPGDDNNPVYQALLAGQKSIVNFLLPDDLLPAADGKPVAVDKGDNTYDAVKNFLNSDQGHKIRQAVGGGLQGSVAQLQLALGGAVNLLGAEISRKGEATALRAQQAALKLYRNLDVTFITLEMKLADYHKFLSEIAFKKLHSEVDDLFRQGSKTVKSIAIAGIFTIADPKLAETFVRVTIWTMDTLENVRKAVQAAMGDLKAATSAAVSGATATLRFARHALTLGHTTAQGIHALGQSVRMTSAQMARFAKTLGQNTGKVLRAAGGIDPLLAAGAVFFQSWSFRDGLREMQTKFGQKRTESLVGVIADGMGIVTGAVEIAGLSIKATGEMLGRATLSTVGKRVLIGGGVLAAGASAVEGVQAWMAAARTHSAGDKDASVAYAASGLLFMIGAGVGGYAAVTGSTALLGGALGLGPLGWALLLLVGAVAVLWWAMNAEDTAAEIWLDRSYFGYGKRAAGKWTDRQLNEELAELNAVLLGLKAEVEWEDNWGKDGVNIKLTMPGFDYKKSAYEYTVSVQHSNGRWYSVIGGRHNVPAPPTYVQAWDGKCSSGPDLSKAFEFSNAKRLAYTETDDQGNKAFVVKDGFLLDENMFSRTKIEFKYWYEKADDEAVSVITHMVAD